MAEANFDRPPQPTPSPAAPVPPPLPLVQTTQTAIQPPPLPTDFVRKIEVTTSIPDTVQASKTQATVVASTASRLGSNSSRGPKSSAIVSAGTRLADRMKKARRLPAWMVSFIFHLALLLLLALIQLPGMNGSAISILLGSDPMGIAEFEISGQQLNPPLPDTDWNSDAVANEIEVDDLIASLRPVAKIESQLDDMTLATMMDAKSIDGGTAGNLGKLLAQGLSMRSGAKKQALLRKGGGTKETEQAVEMALAWLAKQQRSDGSWSLSTPYPNGGVHENTIAATAMALNAYLGAGYHHLEGKYNGNVKRGLDYLMRNQDKEGLFTTGKEQFDQRHYAQALATISILEAYGLTKEERLISGCQRAIDYAQWAQSRLKGWRYQPRADADLSVTGWFVMALQTAKLVGLSVDEAKLNSVHDYLDSVGHQEMARYAYDDLRSPDLTMTAEGLLCRIWLGWSKTRPALMEGIKELLRNIPEETDRTQSIYYWYYATQVLHHYGGEPWDIWNEQMRRVLPALQEQLGEQRGSWSPERDIYGIAGGRLYTTCLAVYCLEVYYRHLAIYDTP